MQHFGEVFVAEIYARGGIVVGGVKRAEGSRETMGFTRRFFWYFSFAVERKVRTFPFQSLRPFGAPPPSSLSASLTSLLAEESLALYTREALDSTTQQYPYLQTV